MKILLRAEHQFGRPPLRKGKGLPLLWSAIRHASGRKFRQSVTGQANRLLPACKIIAARGVQPGEMNGHDAFVPFATKPGKGVDVACDDAPIPPEPLQVAAQDIEPVGRFLLFGDRPEGKAALTGGHLY